MAIRYHSKTFPTFTTQNRQLIAPKLNVYGTHIDLSWAEVPDAVKYKIFMASGATQINVDTDTPIATLTNPTASSYSVNGLSSATVYRFIVVAEISTIGSTSTTVAPTHTITIDSIGISSGTSASVVSSAVAGAASYRFEAIPDAGGSTVTVVQAGTSAVLAGLVVNSLYLFKVTALNGSGSVISVAQNYMPALASITTKLYNPGGFTVTPTYCAYIKNVTTDHASVNWGSITVAAASTVNVSVASGASMSVGNVMDGVTLVLNQLVLLKNQTVASENGFWQVQAAGTAPTRSLQGAAIALVQTGTANGNKYFAATATNTWTQITQAQADANSGNTPLVGNRALAPGALVTITGVGAPFNVTNAVVITASYTSVTYVAQNAAAASVYGGGSVTISSRGVLAWNLYDYQEKLSYLETGNLGLLPMNAEVYRVPTSYATELPFNIAKYVADTTNTKFLVQPDNFKYDGEKVSRTVPVFADAAGDMAIMLASTALGVTLNTNPNTYMISGNNLPIWDTRVDTDDHHNYCIYHNGDMIWQYIGNNSAGVTGAKGSSKFAYIDRDTRRIKQLSNGGNAIPGIEDVPTAGARFSSAQRVFFFLGSGWTVIFDDASSSIFCYHKSGQKKYTITYASTGHSHNQGTGVGALAATNNITVMKDNVNTVQINPINGTTANGGIFKFNFRQGTCTKIAIPSVHTMAAFTSEEALFGHQTQTFAVADGSTATPKLRICTDILSNAPSGVFTLTKRIAGGVKSSPNTSALGSDTAHSGGGISNYVNGSIPVITDLSNGYQNMIDSNAIVVLSDWGHDGRGLFADAKGPFGQAISTAIANDAVTNQWSSEDTIMWAKLSTWRVPDDVLEILKQPCLT